MPSDNLKCAPGRLAARRSMCVQRVNRDVYCRRKPIEKANSFEASINEGYACIGVVDASFMPDSSLTCEGHSHGEKVVRTPRILQMFRPSSSIKRTGLTPARRALLGGLPGPRLDPENPAVTWCYNPSGGITSFGSTPIRHAHKLPSKGRPDRCGGNRYALRGERPGTGPPWPEWRVAKRERRAGETSQCMQGCQNWDSGSWGPD